MCKWLITIVTAVCLADTAAAQSGDTVSKFIKTRAPIIAISNVEVIDGTGTGVLTGQTVLIDNGKIAAVGPTAQVTVPAGATTIDGTSKTLIPGLVGMHEHLFYVSPASGPPLAIEQFLTFPPLYLASGVTTARTTGSMDPYGDLQLKARVNSGQMPGPNFELTTPYLEGAPGAISQMHELNGPADARSLVQYWHSVGFTSAKAYADITPEELQAATEEAHKLHMKVTGHLCSVGFNEAVEMGIDNLEHGPFAAPDGELYSQKKRGVCGSGAPGASRADVGRDIVSKIDPDGPELKQTTQLMVRHNVPLTSTLAVYESSYMEAVDRKELAARTQELMDPVVSAHIDSVRAIQASQEAQDAFNRLRLKKEMAFERKFVEAGGVLMAGCDPTGDGHVIAGLGDQRNMELLSNAGFSISDVIKIATQNGATYLGLGDRIGSIAVGKQADLVLLAGDLAKDISAIEKPELVFKAGVGYDSQAIYGSLRGQQGLH
jgi:imidazolonepropionase-like amidohydrolase